MESRDRFFPASLPCDKRIAENLVLGLCGLTANSRFLVTLQTVGLGSEVAVEHKAGAVPAEEAAQSC